jgi:hypothetical protein
VAEDSLIDGRICENPIRLFLPAFLAVYAFPVLK